MINLPDVRCRGAITSMQKRNCGDSNWRLYGVSANSR